MQAMKIRVNDEAHSKAIQEKLFSMGVEWSQGKVLQHLCAKALYAYTDQNYLAMTYKDEDYFDNHENEEYFLHNGQFLTAEQVARCDQLGREFTEKLTKFRSHKEAARDRMLELMEEITRIVKDDFTKSIPEPLVGELYNLLDMH